MEEYAGTYSDGQSALALDVRVWLGGDGLHISGGGQEVIWPYDQLVSSGPVLARHPAQIGCKTLVGARLHVEDIRFAGSLMDHAPHLGHRAHNRRVLVPMFAAAFAIAAIIAGLYVSNISIAAGIARMIPQGARAKMGDQLAKSMTHGRFCTHPEGVAALHALTARLKRPGSKDAFVVRVGKMGMVNAFTVPGQRIIISKKLLDFADGPDELAGVLAHEMGHALELHPEASIVRSFGLSALGSLMFGQSSNMETLAALMLQLAYSRQAERQADGWALKLLRQARIDAAPLATFFRKIRKKYGDSGRFLTALSTHPATKERIARIEAAGHWAATPALNKAQWAALKKICD